MTDRIKMLTDITLKGELYTEPRKTDFEERDYKSRVENEILSF